MQRFCLIIVATLFIVTPSFAQVLCPDPEDEALSVKGPHIKTNQRSITVVTCRYFEGQKLVGLVVGKYSKSYKFGKNMCKSPQYMEAEIRSDDYQAYATTKDIRGKDNYTEEYWDMLAERLLEDVAEWAIPCNADKKMFKRPLDIRKSK